MKRIEVTPPFSIQGLVEELNKESSRLNRQIPGEDFGVSYYSVFEKNGKAFVVIEDDDAESAVLNAIKNHNTSAEEVAVEKIDYRIGRELHTEETKVTAFNALKNFLSIPSPTAAQTATVVKVLIRAFLFIANGGRL